MVSNIFSEPEPHSAVVALDFSLLLPKHSICFKKYKS